jgi:ubiquinone/menaquinone biosynthesis C-methylase UbiE
MKRKMQQPNLEWWRTTFDEKYVITYQDLLTPERTQKEIGFIKQALRLPKSAQILDLACGWGRHAVPLAKQGYQVTGIDFSPYLIGRARKYAKEEGVRVQFLRKDMRKLAFRHGFDAVICMFGSFGYFASDADHEQVIKGVNRALKRNGQFLIDLYNPFRLLGRLFGRQGKYSPSTGTIAIKEVSRFTGSLKVTTTDSFDPVRTRWNMKKEWKDRNGKNRRYTTSVVIFTPHELMSILARQGFETKKLYGGYNGSPFRFDSRRMIILARKIG